MKYFTIIIPLAVLFFNSSCNSVKNIVSPQLKTNPEMSTINSDNYVYLNDVEDGIALERAKIVSAKKFFDYLMSNELVVKNNEKPYEALLSTSDKIYFGKVVLSPDKKQYVVDPFYATDIEEIKPYFSSYMDITGSNVKAKIFYYFFDRDIETIVKPSCPNSSNYYYSKYNIDLVRDGIRVTAKIHVNCYEKEAFNKEVIAVLNSENLDVLKEFIIMNNYIKGEKSEYGARDDTPSVFKGITPVKTKEE